jgi:hypothetical protein
MLAGSASRRPLKLSIYIELFNCCAVRGKPRSYVRSLFLAIRTSGSWYQALARGMHLTMQCPSGQSTGSAIAIRTPEQLAREAFLDFRETLPRRS